MKPKQNSLRRALFYSVLAIIISIFTFYLTWTKYQAYEFALNSLAQTKVGLRIRAGTTTESLVKAQKSSFQEYLKKIFGKSF
ncbi:MAG: hypothetical protein AAB588_05715 [Patescibacteria group bacterium]|mgnify:CR=1 FL=1